MRLAFKLFDSEGVALVNLLRGGSGALEEMRERARDLGIVLDEHLVRDAERARTELDTLSPNDTAWHTLVATWRARGGWLCTWTASRGPTAPRRTLTPAMRFGIYRWGWGFSTAPDSDGDIALVLCCGACWTGHMVRRWHSDPFGFLRPWNEVPALMGSAPRHVPSTAQA